MRKLTLALFLLLAVNPAFARRHHPAPVRLFPTAGSLVLQNEEADRNRLPRVKNDAMLAELVKDGSLSPLPLSIALKSTVPGKRAYLRPWATDALASLADDEYTEFHRPLTVSSAVRPVTLQRRLWRSKSCPAARADGPAASVHPVGIAFDIGKKSLNREQRRWMEWRLFYLAAIGRVIVEEERACFHIVAVRLTTLTGPEYQGSRGGMLPITPTPRSGVLSMSDPSE